MATAELLAMMTHKTISYFGGSGGIPQMTPEMVAAACAGLKDGPYYLGMAKYAGDMSAKRDLEYCAWIMAADLAGRGGWVIPRGKSYLRGLSLLACEHVLGHHKCTRCHGTGLNKQFGVCHRCGGHKMEPVLSARTVAREAGIPAETYRITWCTRYNEIVGAVQAWEGDLLARVTSQLREAE